MARITPLFGSRDLCVFDYYSDFSRDRDTLVMDEFATLHLTVSHDLF